MIPTSPLTDIPSAPFDALESGYGNWFGVWHTYDEEFLLLEMGSTELCWIFCADNGFPDHLQIRGPVRVCFTPPPPNVEEDVE